MAGPIFHGKNCGYYFAITIFIHFDLHANSEHMSFTQ